MERNDHTKRRVLLPSANSARLFHPSLLSGVRSTDEALNPEGVTPINGSSSSSSSIGTFVTRSVYLIGCGWTRAVVIG